MKKIYLAVIMMMTMVSMQAQTFHKYYSQSGAVGNLNRCIQTSDGGYASVGYVNNTLTLDGDFLIIKTDGSGNILWSNVIAYSGYDTFNDLVETTSGEIVAAGESINATTFVSQAVVVRFDVNGSVVWKQGYDISGGSAFAKAIETDASGNFYVLGNINVSSSIDYYLMKLNSAGSILSQQIYVTIASDFPLALVHASSGDIYFSGWSNDGSGDNIHLFKTDASLTLLWNVLVSDSATGYFCYDMKENSTNNIVLAGRYDDGTTPYDMLLAEFNPGGVPVWAKSYSTTDGLRCYAYGLTVNTAGTIGVAGIVEDTTKGTLVAAASASGTISWSKRIGAASGEYASAYGIGKTSDGGYIVSGPRGSLNGNSSVQLIKTTGSGTFACNANSYSLTESVRALPVQNDFVGSAAGTMTSQNISFASSGISSTGDACVVGIEDIISENDFQIFPNPATNQLAIGNRQFVNGLIEIYSMLGEKVFQTSIQSSFVPIDVSEWSRGVYFVRINSGQKVFSKKVVVE